MRWNRQNFKKQVWIGIGIIAGSPIVFGMAFFILAGQYPGSADTIMKNRDDDHERKRAHQLIQQFERKRFAAAVYQAAMDQLLSTQDNLIAFPTQIDGVSQERRR